MITELLYQEALKFGVNWPIGILTHYADLYARRSQNGIPQYGKFTEAQEEQFQQLQAWLNTIIKTGAVHTPGDWTRVDSTENCFFLNQFNDDAYDAGEKAFERGQPKKCPYPADDDRNRFWFMGYESGEAIDKMMLEREERS